MGFCAYMHPRSAFLKSLTYTKLQHFPGASVDCKASTDCFWEGPCVAALTVQRFAGAAIGFAAINPIRPAYDIQGSIVRSKKCIPELLRAATVFG